MTEKVLLVEDERKTREATTASLQELGYEVMAVGSAHEAIRIAAEERPSMILLDGLLPQMHGFELARFFRADRSYRPRIVLMTAIYKHVRYQNDAKLKYGIDEYLIKPVTREGLKIALMGVAA